MQVLMDFTMWDETKQRLLQNLGFCAPKSVSTIPARVCHCTGNVSRVRLGIVVNAAVHRTSANDFDKRRSIDDGNGACANVGTEH